MAQRDFNEIIRDQLNLNQIKTEHENQEREQEIQPIETGFVNITTGKIHELLNYSIKKGSAKAKELFKQNTGIDLDQLQQNAQDQINKVSNGIEQAKTLVNNTISSAQQISLQNPFVEEPEEPEPEPETVEPEIEIGEDL